MLLGTLGAGWLGNLLIGKATIWPGEGTIRGDEKVLMPPHLLTNFEIRNYNQNEPNLIVLIQETIYIKWTLGHI